MQPTATVWEKEVRMQTQVRRKPAIIRLSVDELEKAVYDFIECFENT